MQPDYTSEQLIAFIAARLRENPSLTMEDLLQEVKDVGYTARRREFEEPPPEGRPTDRSDESASDDVARQFADAESPIKLRIRLQTSFLATRKRRAG